MVRALRVLRTYMSKAACVACSIMLALALPLTLTGCKYTDVLTEHIEDPDNGVEDPHIDPLYENSPDADPEDIISAFLDDSEREDEQELTLPDYAEDQDNQEETDNRQSQEDSAHDQEATEGDEETEDDGENTEVGSGETTTADPSGTGTGKGTGAAARRNQAGEGPVGDVAETGGNGGTVEIYNGDGRNQPLPEVYGSWAAAGPYATIIQMLCGKGGLIACDQEWKDRCLAKGVFPSEGVGDLAVVFTGSLDEGYTLSSIEALKSSGAKGIITNGVTISEADQDAISKAGIQVVNGFPSLNTAGSSDSDVCDAVELVGQLMKTNSNKSLDSQRMANTWRDTHDQVVDACLSANGGYSYKMVAGSASRRIYQGVANNGQTTNLSSNRVTTAYIDSWSTAVTGSSIAVRTFQDSPALYLNGQSMDSSSGVGLSSVVTTSQFALIDYYLQISGVVNNAYDRAAPNASAAGKESQNMVGPGDLSQLDPNHVFATRSVPSALWYTQNSVTRDSTWITVGDKPAFPAVLVRTSEIADLVTGSASRANGLYNVGQPYGVWVVPSGMCGSWAMANPESFLMSLWTLGMFLNDGNVTDCSAVVNSYYEAFYRAPSGAGTWLVDNYQDLRTAECPRG